MAAELPSDNTPLRLDDVGTANIGTKGDKGIVQAQATNSNTWQGYFSRFTGVVSDNTPAAKAKAKPAATPAKGKKYAFGSTDMRLQMVDEGSLSIQYDDLPRNLQWVGNKLITGNVVTDDIPDNRTASPSSSALGPPLQQTEQTATPEGIAWGNHCPIGNTPHPARQ